MADMSFRRKSKANGNGSIPGELTIGKMTWPTIERGKQYTFVRPGTYKLLMTHKTSGTKVQCLCFCDDPAISTHLIHRALSDNHLNLEGCIAPGMSFDENGIKQSEMAMGKVLIALGGFQEGRTVSIKVENVIPGAVEETKEQWIKRRSENKKKK